MIVHNPNNLPTIPIADLLPTQGDLKDLTEVNYIKLKNVIQRRGFSYPVYVWEDNDKILHLLDGHQRQRVLNREGWNEPIPYLKVPAKDLQEAMARLLEITSQYATITQEGIDEFIGKYELNDAEVYEATSFDALAFGKTEVETEVEEDEAPEVSSEPAISKLGGIYQLGKHRVMCGDSTDFGIVSDLMNGNLADMVFTDPPYGVDYDGGHAVKGKRREKLENDGTPDIYADSLPNAVELSKDGAAFYVWYSDSKSLAVLQAVLQAGLEVRNHIIWNKNMAQFGAIGAQYKSKHEPCLYMFKKGKSPKWYGANNEVSVWDISRATKNEFHPTQKPVELVARAINNSSKSGDNILDLFLGSGSTLIACEQTDRTCYGMELDPKYVDVIRKRYAKFTNKNELPDNWEELTPALNTGNIQA